MKNSLKILIFTMIAIFGILTIANFYTKPSSNKFITVDEFTIKEVNNIIFIDGFKQPFSINFDKDKSIYVTERYATVTKFDQNLKFIGSLTADGWVKKHQESSLFTLPHSIDFDDEGNIYVSDYYDNCIKKFSKNGSYLKSFTEGIVGPATAYFGLDGYLYIADFDANAIIIYEKDGNYIDSIKNGFNKLHCIRFDSKNKMYVVDTWNHRILKYDVNGEFEGMLCAKKGNVSTEGWEKEADAIVSELEGGFNAPVSIDFDDNDNLYISEFGNNRIQCFSSNGTFLFSIYGFNAPYDLKILEGKLYVADTKNNRIQIISLS